MYFVSSNTHALANLLGGYALCHTDELLETARRENPDNVAEELEAALKDERDDAANLLYFALRAHLHRDPEALEAVQAWDAESGITWTWNSEMTELRADFDDDGDGAADGYERWIVDAQARVTDHIVDTSNRSLIRYSWTYDDQGRVLTYGEDVDDDGLVLIG